ncbi:hypothetical protein PS676_00289 [Pseudomonas fluorescens]|nr:hypothetical protein PS676_00289 [Pseudomonas fluorescens]
MHIRQKPHRYPAASSQQPAASSQHKGRSTKGDTDSFPPDPKFQAEAILSRETPTEHALHTTVVVTEQYIRNRLGKKVFATQ